MLDTTTLVAMFVFAFIVSMVSWNLGSAEGHKKGHNSGWDEGYKIGKKNAEVDVNSKWIKAAATHSAICANGRTFDVIEIEPWPKPAAVPSADLDHYTPC